MTRGRILDTGYFPFYDDDFEDSNIQGIRSDADGAQQSINTDQSQNRSAGSNDQRYKTGVVILSLVTTVLILVCFCLVIVNLNLKKSNEILSNFEQCVLHKRTFCKTCIGKQHLNLLINQLISLLSLSLPSHLHAL